MPLKIDFLHETRASYSYLTYYLLSVQYIDFFALRTTLEAPYELSGTRYQVANRQASRLFQSFDCDWNWIECLLGSMREL